jgi:thioesterase domain-containing protein
MNSIANIQWALRLQAEFNHSIPITRAMGIKVINYDGERLELSAPLAANINDKGTAFGGSISCILTLAAWGVVWIACARENIACDIVIHKGEITYHKPVTIDLQAVCKLPDKSEIEGFMARFNKKGRARLGLRSELLVEGDIMTEFDCQYAALLAKE